MESKPVHRVPIIRDALLVFLAALLGVASAHAQEPYTPPTYNAPRVETPPAIDGRLDDACWRLAAEAPFVLLGEPAHLR